MIILDIYSPENLISLCSNHHKIADAFDCNQLLNVNLDKWREIISKFLYNSKATSEEEFNDSGVYFQQNFFGDDSK